MDSRELREKRAKLVVDAQALIPTGGSISAENRSKFDALMADADVLKADIDRIERVAAADAELRKTQTPPNPTMGRKSQTDADRVKIQGAFRNWLKNGMNELDPEDRAFLQPAFKNNALTLREHRDNFDPGMGVGGGSPLGSLGGFFVPQGFVYDIDIALKYYGDMFAVATELATATGQPLPYPTANDTTVLGELVGEGEQVTGADVNVGHIIFGAYKFSTKLVKVSLELIQDSAFNIENFLKDQFAIRLGRILNYYFTQGDGTSEPQGIVGAATDSGITVLGDTNLASPDPTTQVGWEDLIHLEHSVDRLYRRGAKYMFHDYTLAGLKLLKDKYGRPLWVPGIANDAPDKINNYEYSINNDMDSIVEPSPVADRVTVVFGQLGKYLIRKVKELAILRLVERFADYGQVAFIGFARYDGNLIDAGTHPVKYLTTPGT
jgi:HK97 family phage major capsid protein